MVKKQNVPRPDKDQIKDFLLKWLPTFYKLQSSDDIADERYYNLMYTGNAHFLFYRLHGLLCERLTMIRDRAVEILIEHEAIGDSGREGESIAGSIGMKNALGVNPDDYYPAFLELVKAFADGSVDGAVYEDTLREMFTTKAYIAFTMDKLIQSTAKYCIEIVQKENCINIQHLHREESDVGRTRGPIQQMNDMSPDDQAYRKKVENALEEEFLFRVTVSRFKAKSQIGIQLMNIDEDDDDDDRDPVDRDRTSEKDVPVTIEEDEEEEEDVVQSPTPLFLKRNVLHIKSLEREREKRFTTQAGSISMSKSIPVNLSHDEVKKQYF